MIGKQLIAYLPARGPVVLGKLVVLLRELVGLCVRGPGSVSRNNTALTMLIGEVVGGKLNKGNARLEITFVTWWPVDADIKFDTAVRDTMVDFEVRVVIGSKDGDLALGAVVELLVDEVQDMNLVLFSLCEGLVSSVCSKVNALYASSRHPIWC